MNLCALFYIHHVFDQYCLLKIFSFLPVCISVLFLIKNQVFLDVWIYFWIFKYIMLIKRFLKYAAVDSNSEISFFVVVLYDTFHLRKV